MSLFFAMLAKLFPLYATMGAGFGLSRAFGNMAQTLAQIQIYFLLPIITLTSLMKLSFTSDLLVLPCFRFALCLAISAAAFALAKRYARGYAPLLAHASGASNIGYLGIPIATILLPESFLPVYILTSVGGTIYENTFGFYWMSRGRYQPRDAVRKLLCTPLVYAVILGLSFNLLGVRLPAMWEGLARDFLGAFVVLGALIIGIGLAGNGKMRLSGKLLSTICAVKFVIWPVATLALIVALRFTSIAVPQAYEPILLLMSFLPMAANTASLSALMDVYPDEAAAAVAATTLLSVIIIPVYALLFGIAHG